MQLFKVQGGLLKDETSKSLKQDDMVILNLGDSLGISSLVEILTKNRISSVATSGGFAPPLFP
jgi:hypothetical protein